MTTSKIDIKKIGNEITALLAICLDIETPEKTRIILRHELKLIKLDIDKIIAENE